MRLYKALAAPRSAFKRLVPAPKVYHCLFLNRLAIFRLAPCRFASTFKTRSSESFRSLDFDLDESDRVRRAIHDIVLDTGLAHVGLTGDERNIRYGLAVMNLQNSIGQHHNKIRPSMAVPSRDSARLKIPTRDAQGRIILLNRRPGRSGALKSHRSFPRYLALMPSALELISVGWPEVRRLTRI